ncbi:TraB/GumN family protein [Oceanimonas sp. CHS3-5]|uniref:TraB/GumN family protein n=1 Tax=Oceanimonas sp. CHS3-5 TaxID=3068186 RepID=UPI00273D581B|nr:TraB/GumN family protein [Oceanimonas sp. CHS3-5]MDP5292305.1 TraB/GumN family protein [Oceanimonas sp. CHS3-5]
MKRILHLLLWLWCGQTLAAPALWQATRDNQQLWLFGSVHIADERLATLPPPLLEAFEHSELLLLEVDPLTLRPDNFMHLIERNTDWPARLGERLAQDLEQAVARSGRPALRQLPPWFAALQLTQLKAAKLGFHNRQGVDMQLRLLAQDQQLPVSGLEQPALVMGLLASLHERGLERDFVAHSLEELEQLQDHLDHLLTAWLSGDEQALQALLQEQQSPALTGFIENELLIRRNHMWLTQLEQLAPQRALMVVGALHLYGDQGLISLLQQAGYTLNEVGDKPLY